MKIFSETGFLIIIDPTYLKLANSIEASGIDFLSAPELAAQLLSQHLFPNGCGELVGLVRLSDGPGTYDFDAERVQFWDVETTGNKVIFGVDHGSYIIFDIKYIQPLIRNFDKNEFDTDNSFEHFQQLQQKISNRYNILLWCPSPLPFAEGWHEVDLSAFQKSK
ncbi:MAG: hypothetical protein ACOY90_08870 [Candidatus Zhuqueibacterota bacterium]